MNTDLGMPIINKTPKTSLNECLEGYTKSILFKVGDQVNATLKKSHKKSRLAESLSAAILDYLEYAEQDLSQSDWTLLNELVESNQRLIDTDELPAFSYTAQHGYVFVFRKGISMYAVIPDEVADIVAKMSKEDNEEDRDFARPQAEATPEEEALLKLYQNTKNIYGAANLAHLTFVWNTHHETQYSVEEVESIIHQRAQK